ncbi:glutamate receptor ionotropic, kainate 3-like isoform X2 [Tubulanus polymorphus]
METPFLKMRDGYLNYNGNRRYEGFIVDLMEALAKEGKFRYIMTTVKDDRYGSRDDHGNWNGMIGEVNDMKADLAAAALTVTDLRKKVVDFSDTIMENGVTIMANKKDINPYGSGVKGLAYFLSPFTVGSWLLILVSFLLVAALLTAFNYFHPYEYRARSRRGEVEDKTNPGKAIKDSLWFAISTMFLQGFYRSPLSIASRTAAAFWFFFVLVTIATYLAGLVYFFSNVSQEASFTKLEDLVHENDIKIGTIYGGSTISFFKNSPDKDSINFKAYMKIIADGKSNFVNNAHEAVSKVKQGGYAFIGESSYIDYSVARDPDCSLVEVGGIIQPRNHAIAFKQGSPYVALFNKAIRAVKASGELERLHDKWWHAGQPCADTKIMPVADSAKSKSPEKRKPLFAVPVPLDVFGGPLILLLSGLILSVTIAVFEIVYYKLRGQKTPRRKPLSVYNEENSNEKEAKI